eukprot:401333-Alexandrium_andersonii.AAC.1
MNQHQHPCRQTPCHASAMDHDAPTCKQFGTATSCAPSPPPATTPPLFGKGAVEGRTLIHSAPPARSPSHRHRANPPAPHQSDPVRRNLLEGPVAAAPLTESPDGSTPRKSPSPSSCTTRTGPRKMT